MKMVNQPIVLQMIKALMTSVAFFYSCEGGLVAEKYFLCIHMLYVS